MKATLLFFLLCLFCFDDTLYQYEYTAIGSENSTKLSQFKGRKILVVNTACKSTYTYQLEGLQQLHTAYGDKLAVIGFPTGADFEKDEVATTNRQILEFCRTNYGVTFPLTKKTSTRGADAHPLFTYLAEAAKEAGYDAPVIKAPFTKFLIDEQGKLLAVWGPDVTPLSNEITSRLNNSWVR